MSAAAEQALADAGCERRDIDGLLCGYSTTLPHLMLSTVFAEHFGLRPAYAHAVQLGGATGFALVMLATRLVDAGVARRILVVAGENRLTGQTREAAIQTLAQIGHPVYEVALGPTVPAYYALVASRYMHDHAIREEDLAELAVLMRRHAAGRPGAHLTRPITVDDVMASKPIAAPLKILDCCPISDGGAALVVSREPGAAPSIRVSGCGQAHLHQHVTEADLTHFGASVSAAKAFAEAGIGVGDVRYAGIYDSFTITLTILLEEIGFVARGTAGARAREGWFARDGRLPMNLHGGLLSYGHCGVAGALAHLAETCLQMTGRAGDRQVRDASPAFLHGDGGVLSSHVSLVLERQS
jgi:acetyl-CoA acetyltransferase